MSKTILIVDDDPEIRTTLNHYLGGEGFGIEAAANGKQMTEAIDRGSIDLVLLDLGLQNESGLDLLRTVSFEAHVAVVILTGKSDPIERVVGLELGADDYIVKPFLNRELLARINAVLRRTSPHPATSNSSHQAKPKKMQIDNWVLDIQTRKIQTTDGIQVNLTGTEFDLLATLASNAGEPMTRDELSTSALNREWVPSDRSIDIHIHNLRRKLSFDEELDNTIVAVRNVGYQLAAEVIAR